MKISKVKDLYLDWVKGGYRFGLIFSEKLAEKLEISPKKTKVGGIVFDVAAGGGLTYLAVTSAIGSVTGAAAAVMAVTAAPVAAVVAVAVATVWLALSCVTGGIGLGLLNAAHKKFDRVTPSKVVDVTHAVIEKIAAPVHGIFRIGAKLSGHFKEAVVKKQKKAAPKPAPAPHGSFKF